MTGQARPPGRPITMVGKVARIGRIHPMIKRDTHSRIHQVDRRQLLKSAAFGGAAALAGGYPLVARAAGQPALVTSIRSLSNPYHAVWKIGADDFAKAVGIPSTVLVTEANSEK